MSGSTIILSDKATEPSFRRAPAAALALFRERGYHIERDLVSEARCDALVAVGATLPGASDGSYKPVSMAHRVHPAFLEMMRDPAIVAIAEQIIGAPASGLGSDFSYMQPGTPGFTNHQDNFFVQAPPDAFVSAWLALSAVRPENGGLVFYPGSHKLGMLAVRDGDKRADAGQNPGARVIETIVPDGIAEAELRMEKGSVLFIHSLLVHRSSANVSQAFRHSFLATYIRKGAPFRAGEYQRRTEIALRA